MIKLKWLFAKSRQYNGGCGIDDRVVRREDVEMPSKQHP